MLLDGAISVTIGFAINFIIALIIIRGIYYKKQKDYNYVFTFLIFNTVTYFVMGLFTSVVLSVGVGFGLFALFSILRYRTETVPIREMTYLFVMVALPVLNASLFETGNYGRLIASNLIVIVVIFILEKGFGFNYEKKQQVSYEKIDLININRRDELIQDLSDRTGFDVISVDVIHTDYLKDSAELIIHYREKKN